MGADGVRRVDWHNYEAIRNDAARTGGSAKIMLRNRCSLGHTHTHTQSSKSIESFSLPTSSIGFSLFSRMNQSCRNTSEIIIKHS